jgi:hypothetical protein
VIVHAARPPTTLVPANVLLALWQPTRPLERARVALESPMLLSAARFGRSRSQWPAPHPRQSYAAATHDDRPAPLSAAETPLESDGSAARPSASRPARCFEFQCAAPTTAHSPCSTALSSLPAPSLRARLVGVPRRKRGLRCRSSSRFGLMAAATRTHGVSGVQRRCGAGGCRRTSVRQRPRLHRLFRLESEFACDPHRPDRRSVLSVLPALAALLEWPVSARSALPST